jgi:hypothetical protein
MKVLIVGATGSIGNTILQSCLHHPSITRITTLTRRALPSFSPKYSIMHIPDFGALDNVSEDSWSRITDADALIWAIGTYDLNADVNLNYPLAFQKELATRLKSEERKRKFRFILLGGAFTETNQSQRLFFLWEQRRMKGLLQTLTLQFAQERSGWWEAVVIRPGGVLLGGDTWRNWAVQGLFGDGLAIRAKVLGACVAELVVGGKGACIVENAEMVEMGRGALDKAV